MQETTLSNDNLSQTVPSFARNVLKKLQFFSEIELYNALLSHPNIQILFNFLDYNFQRPELFVASLTHSSFVNEGDEKLINYERLEFIGDTVLSTLISKELLSLYPEFNEGDLSKARGALVNEKSLAELSRLIDIGPCLLLGKGEIKNGGDDRDSILADAFESLLGALFLDGGLEASEVFLKKTLNLYGETEGTTFFDPERFSNFDAKTKLQELTMKLYGVTPVYLSTEVADREFKVELLIKDHKILELVMNSKKKAEMKLAFKAIKEKLYMIEGA